MKQTTEDRQHTEEKALKRTARSAREWSVCHLGVAAIRLGCKLNWNAELEHFVDDKEPDSFLAREQRKPFTYDMI